MKITAKARYALRILMDIALNEKRNHPRTIREIADEQGIGEKFISRIAVSLREAGMIHSSRGPDGGFRLAKAPCDISLLAIIEALQGEISIVDCISPDESCPRKGTCVTRTVWSDVNTLIRSTLRTVTLEQILMRVETGATIPTALSEYAI